MAEDLKKLAERCDLNGLTDAAAALRACAEREANLRFLINEQAAEKMREREARTMVEKENEALLALARVVHLVNDSYVGSGSTDNVLDLVDMMSGTLAALPSETLKKLKEEAK